MGDFINKNFPTFGLKNIRVYYLLGIFLSGWFIVPNWVFFYSRYLTIKQIGVIDGLSVLLYLLLQIPTGALSDLFGKKMTIIIGSLFIIIANILIIIAQNYWLFLIGNMLTFVGMALYTGATEAFAYDSLIENNLKDKYSLVSGKFNFICVTTTVATYILGGVLYGIYNPAAYIAWNIFLVISIYVISIGHEPLIEKQKLNLKNYIFLMKDGFTTIFSKRLIMYIIPILGIYMFIGTNQGVVRQSLGMYFGFDGVTFGYIMGFATIPAAFISFHLHEVQKFLGDKKLLLALIGLYIFAFALTFLNKELLTGTVLFVFITIAEKVARPFMSILLNERIASKHRATALSSVIFISQIPYAVLMVGFTFMIEQTFIPHLLQLFVGYMFVLFAYTLVSFTMKKRNITEASVA